MVLGGVYCTYSSRREVGVVYLGGREISLYFLHWMSSSMPGCVWFGRQPVPHTAHPMGSRATGEPQQYPQTPSAKGCCSLGTGDTGVGFRNENVAQVPVGVSEIFSGFCASEVW